MGSGTSKTKRPRLRIRKPLSDQDWRDWANEVHAGHMRATDMQNHCGQWITLRANTQAGVLEYFEGGEWRGLGCGAGGGGTASARTRIEVGAGAELPNHNLLPGLQGGAPWRGEYYHFQQAAHDELARFWDGGQWDLSNAYMADGHVDTLHVRQRIGIGSGAEASPGYALHVQQTVSDGDQRAFGYFRNPSTATSSFVALTLEADTAKATANLAMMSSAFDRVSDGGSGTWAGKAVVYSGESADAMVMAATGPEDEFWVLEKGTTSPPTEDTWNWVASFNKDGLTGHVSPFLIGVAADPDVLSIAGGAVTVNGAVTIIAPTYQLLLQEDHGQQLRIYDTSTATQSVWDFNPLTVNATDGSGLRFFRGVNTSGPRFISIFKGDGTAASTMLFDAAAGSLDMGGDLTAGGIIYADQISPVGNTIGVLTAANANYSLYLFDNLYPDGTPSYGPYIYTCTARATAADTNLSTYGFFIRALNRSDAGYSCTGWLVGHEIWQAFHPTDVTGHYAKAAALYIQPIASIGAAAGLTNNYAIYVAEPAGGDNNYAIYAAGGAVRLGGALTVTYSQPNVSITGTSTGTNAYAIVSIGAEAGTDTTAGVRFHNDATGWHIGVHTDDSWAISHSYGGTMSSIVMSVTGYATSAVVRIDGRLVFGNNATSMENRSVGWNSTSGGMWMCGSWGVNFGSYRYASSSYDNVVRILGPWDSGIQAKMWPQYDAEVWLGDASHRWGPIFASLKSGTTQGAAGAAAGELWVDTDDGYTVKMGV